MLRFITFSVVILALGAAAFAQQGAPVADNWKKIAIPALPNFKPQQPVRIVLPNGLVVFLQEDHELPIVHGYMRIRGGARNEPADKVGLVSLLGSTWRAGGSTNISGDKLDDYLELRAAMVETSGNLDSTSVHFDCLKGDFADVFKVFVDLLENPAFPEDKLALNKMRINSGIDRRNDDSSSIVRRESAYLRYGRQSVYGRSTEHATLNAVARQDLVDFHKRYVHPNNAYLGIVGDFDAKQMEAAIRAALGSWAKGEAAAAPKLDYAPAKPGLYFADKDDVNQSEILFIAPGVQKDNPDYVNISVFNELFGGGFAARLFSNLRTKQGLAYAVGGAISGGFDHPTLTHYSIGTKSETTGEAIKRLYEQLDLLKTQPPTAEELKRAKDGLLNSFIFEYDSPDKVLNERIAYEFYGYPSDYLEKFRAGVEKATLADMNKVIDKYIHKDQFSVLVVGNLKEVEEQLKPFGPINKLDITIPSDKNAPGDK